MPFTQDYIISRLKNADYLRYSDMRPSDTPNDLYNYHLKHLIKKGLVAKTTHGYHLTAEGQRHVADVHHTGDQSNRLFKINVITIVSRRTSNGIEILNQVRGSQPSFGKVGVMGGTIVKGEPLLQAASRKLKDETGLDATFRLIGHERRMTHEGGQLFSDVLFPICYADSHAGILIDTEYGHNFWVPIETAITNENDPHDSIASITTVLEAIATGALETLPLFYAETSQERT